MGLVKAFYLYGFGALIEPLPRVPFNSPVLSLGYEQMLPFPGKYFAPQHGVDVCALKLFLLLLF